MEKRYNAVLIDTPSNQPNRFYCDKDGRPVLWAESNARDPHEVAMILIANDVKARAVQVLVSVIEKES